VNLCNNYCRKSLTFHLLESIADYTKRPLYPIRSCDLGIEAVTLEKSLNESFEVAAKWNAIILLDEADVYLEERRSNELQRNSLVAGNRTILTPMS
jgi:hypothetical protein